MSNILLNKKQFDLVTHAAKFEVNLKIAEDNWSRFSTEEKQIVLELCKVIYPKKSNLIKEAEWYNLVGDILGIADPTGVVDVVNGISYFSQGDHLFGLLKPRKRQQVLRNWLKVRELSVNFYNQLKHGHQKLRQKLNYYPEDYLKVLEIRY
jgi:hypothetical protein